MKLIATDLDRTLLPNGKEKLEGRLGDFNKKIDLINDLVLAYVTGRNLELFKQAREEFKIRTPDFLLASVGSEIYKKTNRGELIVFDKWIEYLKEKHPEWDRKKILNDLETNENFYLQENSVQNPYKLSFYLKTKFKEKILSKVNKYIKNNQFDVEVVYSVDPIKEIGLLDILPTSATKKGALEFLITELGVDKKDVVFAGDSGNDLLALTMGINSILVNNARDDVKKEAIRLAKKNNLEDKLFISNKNYSDGIIEGLNYFNLNA